MAARPPNLLLIVTDQQQRGTLAAYGNHVIQMPALNALAERSTVFERCYCAQPVCGPARGTLFTGTYPHYNGQVTLDQHTMRPEVPYLTDLLDDRWTTGFLGRTGHHRYPDGPAPRAEALDEVAYFDLAPAEVLRAAGFEPRDGTRFGKVDRPHIPEQLGGPAYAARRACDFIQRNAAAPFTLVVSLFEPHDPLNDPLNDLHPLAEVSLPDNFAPPQANQPRRALLEHLTLINTAKDGVRLLREEDWRLLLQRYWGLCAQVDRAVGRILRQLEDSGIDDQTLIVFTSDHGEMAASHQLWGKNQLFEESIGVPLLIRRPGQRVGNRAAAPVGHADLVATILDELGVAIPPHVQGRSLRADLDGSPPAEAVAFVSWTGVNHLAQAILEQDPLPPWMAAVTTRRQGLADLGDAVRGIVTADGWKLCLSETGAHELYDLDADPGELRNLESESAQRVRLADLTARIRTWQRDTGDALELGEGGR